MKWMSAFAIGICAALLASAPIALAQGRGGDSQLAGLWAATRFYGPEVRGDLWIEERGGSLTAEIAGRRASVRVERDGVSFALPNGLGSFRGAFTERRTRIEGHWVQPGRFGYASPVSLRAAGRGQWRGEVAPLDERMTVYLMLSPGADGAMAAFVRNPERNFGVFFNINRLERSGDNIQLMGRLRRNGPESAVVQGRYDPTTERLALDFSSRGGVFDFVRADANDEAGFYPRGRHPARYVYSPPPPRGDGWPVASLEDVGIDRSRISAFVQSLIDAPMDSMEAPDIHGLLIARHGKLVLEEYFHNFGRDRLHDTRSAAKTVASLLVGASMLAGARFGPSSHVYEVLGVSTDDPRKRAMTVEHLLTQSSGYFCDDDNPDAPGNEDRMWDQTEQPDWWRYTLDVPMASDPGTHAVYCSMQPNLLGAVMSHATSRWLPELFADRIARPLGIARYSLNLMPNGDAYMGGGMYFEPRDFMKIGQLVLNGGIWHGQRVVSREWIERSTSPITRIGDGRYGYLWWIEDYPYHGRTVRAVYAGGNGGQLVMAIPEFDLVVAFYGGNYNARAGAIARRAYVPESILPAVLDERQGVCPGVSPCGARATNAH